MHSRELGHTAISPPPCRLSTRPERGRRTHSYTFPSMAIHSVPDCQCLLSSSSVMILCPSWRTTEASACAEGRRTVAVPACVGVSSNYYSHIRQRKGRTTTAAPARARAARVANARELAEAEEEEEDAKRRPEARAARARGRANITTRKIPRTTVRRKEKETKAQMRRSLRYLLMPTCSLVPTCELETTRRTTWPAARGA